MKRAHYQGSRPPLTTADRQDTIHIASFVEDDRFTLTLLLVPMLSGRWISLLLFGLITSSLVEPVIGAACAEQAHLGTHAMVAADHSGRPVTDDHDGRPVQHPGHGSGADHCMHQHGTAFGAGPVQLAITTVGLNESVESIATTPPLIVLPPPFHPPRA